MKNIILFLISILVISCVPYKEKTAKKWHLIPLKNLPEPITNSAVVEGFAKGKAYVFCFGGLDSTKLYSGIHRRSYRLDISDNTWQRIADLPDSLGKIASAASRVKDKIYIIGGYYVFKDHSEKSSNKVHRYNIVKNRFLEDGASIPVPIDDHVQGVWRDSLIYIITGWSNKANVPSVQIYNPSNDSWMEGTPVPNNNKYKSFGASGTIIGDTIYYMGGASMGKNYPIQNILRIGMINTNDPTQIDWSYQALDSTKGGYRMAATKINSLPHWLGGSRVTYNYNAIAYNGSGGVKPSERYLFLEDNHIYSDILENISMDFRGLGEINDSTKIIIGGIKANQRVSNKVYKIEWRE